MKKSLILITLGIVLYSFSLLNGFVWDDEVFIQQNPILSHNTNTMMTQTYFRPVMSFINGALFALFGPQPFFFHLFSVVFHIATAVILLYLFKRFFDEKIAFVLSLLFLIHPTNVEAVCFASALQEVLFTFTGVIGLYLLVRSKRISVVTVFVSVILLTLALLMKETGIVFFALIFCYLVLFHRKNTNAIQLYAAFAIIILFTYVLARFSSGNVYVQSQGLFPIMRVSLETRLINIPMIILYYLSMFFFPFNLGIAQHWVVRTVDFTHFWLPLLVVGGLFTVCAYLSFRRNEETEKSSERSERDLRFAASKSASLDFLPQARNDNNDEKVFLFFFLWFLIGLLPHLQLVALNMTVAERWLYFPMIGLLGMLGSLCHSEHIRQAQYRLREKSSEAKKDSSYVLKSLRMTLIIIIILFFLRSFVRTLDWRNGLALFGHDITNTSSFDLQNNFGVELFRAGKYAQAKPYFETSTRLAPYWWVNWNNLGASYEREQNFVKAQECYEKSIQNGQYGLGYENLAKILVLHGTDKQKAVVFLNKALQLFPESKTLQMLQGRLLGE